VYRPERVERQQRLDSIVRSKCSSNLLVGLCRHVDSFIG